jgi:hypothetical protein
MVEFCVRCSYAMAGLVSYTSCGASAIVLVVVGSYAELPVEVLQQFCTR